MGGPQGQSGRLREISTWPGFEHRKVQPVASRYTDWAIPVDVSNTTPCLNVFNFLQLNYSDCTDSWWRQGVPFSNNSGVFASISSIVLKNIKIYGGNMENKFFISIWNSFRKLSLSLSLSLSPSPPPSLCLCVSLFPINNRQGALSGILQECRYIFLWSFFYSYLLRQYWIVQNTGMRRITTIRWKTDRILQCSHKIVILYYTILYYTILYYIMLYYIKLY